DHHLALERPVDRVVAQHVGQVVGLEQVVDRDDLDVLAEVLHRRAQHVAPDAAETVDADPDCHDCPTPGRGLDWRERSHLRERIRVFYPATTFHPSSGAAMRRPVAVSSVLACSLAVLLGAASGPAHAWSALGHQLVGELAQRHLAPATRAEVARLLAGEQQPTLAGIADWADRLRDLDPGRLQATSRWHYVNTPPGQQCDYVVERDCPDGECVVGAIQAQRAILADTTQPLEARRDALKFIVHFVCDVHQPMHANNYDDLGGNRFQVSLRTDLEPEAYARRNYVDGVMGTNLHSVWDYYILGTEGLSLSRYADRLDALPWPP